MKRIDNNSMRNIASKMYPNCKFEDAMKKLTDSSDWKLVTPLTANNHYCVMDKLLKYLD